jgi:hypothetical protein
MSGSTIFLDYMDSNDKEIINVLLEEETDVAAASADEHMKILSSLLDLYARDAKP